MFGPTYEAACAGCTGLADGFDGALLHLNNRDITLMAISRAPIEKLVAYKHRMGWQFPYVSSHGSDFNFDFDFDLLAPYYYQLLDQVPDGRDADFPLRRHDEY